MHCARRTVLSHTVHLSTEGCAMTTIVTILPCGHAKPPALPVSAQSMSDLLWTHLGPYVLTSFPFPAYNMLLHYEVPA
jgi:hypothetical protein